MSEGVYTELAEPKTFVSIDLPVTVRMNVLADDVTQAHDIINALLGNGDWVDSRNVGLPFAVKTIGANP